jgi:hypothetical protein
MPKDEQEPVVRGYACVFCKNYHDPCDLLPSECDGSFWGAKFEDDVDQDCPEEL